MKKNKPRTLTKTALSSGILWALGSANAATINVDGACSLSEAISAANTDLPVGTCGAGSGSDTIQVINPDTNITINTIFQSSTGPGDVGLPIINSNVTIEGNGLTLSANNSTDNFRLLEVTYGGDLTLRDTTVSNANDGYGIGSGLFSFGGRVTLENTTFASNNGAVMLAYSLGNVITDTTIRHNYLNAGPFAVGLTAYVAEVDISNSSIVDNQVQFGGGAPLAANRGVGITSAGGASFVQSTITLNQTTISGNNAIYGAAITIGEVAPPFVDSGPFGGAGNRGVIQNDVTITNATLTDNTAFIAAGILDFTDQGALTIQGSLISGNHEINGPFAPNIYSIPGYGTMNLDANNIIGDRGFPGTFGVTLGPSDSSFSNETTDNIYPLTLTNGQLLHPLKTGSPAIDGNDPSCFGSTNDQEGKGRGIDGDQNGSFICDVGSFEHSLPIIADDAPCTLSNAIVSANNDTSVGGCQPGVGHDIITLPENSTQSLDAIQYVDPNFTNSFGLPAITSGVTIAGHGSTLERSGSAVDDFGLLIVASDAQLNLIDTAVSGGTGTGPAVFGGYYGNINIVNSAIIYNNGGGFFDLRSINSSLVNSTIAYNQVLSGGINQGFAAGLSSYGSMGFEVVNSTISNNANVSGFTGGLDFRGVGMARISNSTLSGNTGGNYGATVFTAYQKGNSTFDGITVTNNESSSIGGMLIFNTEPNAITSLRNSIVSGDLTSAPSPNEQISLFNLPQNNVLGSGPTSYEIYASGNVLLDGDNIIGHNGNAAVVGVPIGPSDVVPPGPASTVINPVLADNGGNTLTHLPVPGGLAVDSGGTNCGLARDQVGNLRPWDGDDDGTDRCDAGAVELNSIPVNDIIFKDGFDPVIIMRSGLKQ